MTRIVRIVAKRPQFRRAGLAHPDGATDHPAGRFTAAQLAALKAEPMLVVQEIELPDKAPKPAAEPEAAADGAKGKGGKKS